ncbi:hypothetical protein N7509_003875 [Penicillium cosmopolitanum]|uniref:Uncharacterized protein n=1 Tax=Penicillium cosmopolitanum TaxID=1131564 RepID=A0A9W9W5T4_9EURO|nr:uncharacterized protein N7509_003875 [Penicillium cosmopolitanum]KAJ5404004.1 hypothetical protein N7509_003875 [Penicillium cosmopolitanum]
MSPISLDEIIHYRPPTEKTQFQVPQSIGLYPNGYSNLSSKGPIPSRPFQPNQVRPSGFPLWRYAQGPRMIPRSPVEFGPLLPLTESAGEVALDLSDEMGMVFPNMTLEKDTDDPVSNANWSNSSLLKVFDGASLTDPGSHCDIRTQGYRWCQGIYMAPLQYPGEPDSVKEPTVSSLASPGDELFPAAEAKESENKTLPSIFADSAKVKDGILQDSATTKEDLNITINEHSLSSTAEKNPDSSFGLLSSDVASSTGDAEAGLNELRQSPAFTNSEEILPKECGGYSTAEFCEST